MQNIQHKKVEIDLFESYISFVVNAVGSRQYQNLIATVDGEKRDILKGGELSCAAFASSVLNQFSLIDRPHATVGGTATAMGESGWFRIDEPRRGCVLRWEAREFEGESHEHIGFYVDDSVAISNSAIEKVPVRHDWNFVGSKFGERSVTEMYWHHRLGEG